MVLDHTIREGIGPIEKVPSSYKSITSMKNARMIAPLPCLWADKTWIFLDPIFVQWMQAGKPDLNSQSIDKFAKKRIFLAKPLPQGFTK